MKLIETIKSSSIRVKLISLFLLTSTLIFAVNVYVYINLNAVINHVDEIYAGNVALTEMEETLEAFCEEFPPLNVVKNEQTVEEYLNPETGNCQDHSGAGFSLLRLPAPAGFRRSSGPAGPRRRRSAPQRSPQPR